LVEDQKFKGISDELCQVFYATTSLPKQEMRIGKVVRDLINLCLQVCDASITPIRAKSIACSIPQPENKRKPSSSEFEIHNQPGPSALSFKYQLKSPHHSSPHRHPSPCRHCPPCEPRTISTPPRPPHVAAHPRDEDPACT